MSKQDIEYEIGSGNVFADLGLPNPEERLLKARLASTIYDIIEARGWTQKHAAEVLGVSQPDVSKMTRGILKDFSVERLLHFLSRLEQRITISIQDKANVLPSQEIVVGTKDADQSVNDLDHAS